MAKNLLDKGHEVVAFDVSASVLDEAVNVGAKKATSPKVPIYWFHGFHVKHKNKQTAVK